MKNKTIHITSVTKGAEVTIHNGCKKTTTRLFSNIDEAIQFVLPQGDRRTSLLLNGYPTTLYGWVQKQ